MNRGAVPHDPQRFDPERLAAVLADPARVDLLRRTGLMDSAPEEAFDRWAALAARALRTPVAMVALFDDRRQYLKSAVGLEEVAGRSAAPDLSICQYVVAGNAPLAVDDTRLHPEVSRVAGPLRHGLVSYAGTPIVVDGHALGSLCVVQ